MNTDLLNPPVFIKLGPWTNRQSWAAIRDQSAIHGGMTRPVAGSLDVLDSVLSIVNGIVDLIEQSDRRN